MPHPQAVECHLVAALSQMLIPCFCWIVEFGVDAEKLPEFILECAPDCPPALVQLASECVNEGKRGNY